MQTQKSRGHPVNQGIANTLGEHNDASKGAHCIHHVLIIRKNGNTNLVAIAINVALLDVVESHLRLVGVTCENFSKDGCTNLVPHELQKFTVDVEAYIGRIGVGHLQTKIQCFQ